MIEPAKSTSSLFRRVLRNMAIRIALAALVMSAISYYYSYVRLQEEALESLGKYISARSQMESDLFLQAETNTKLVRNEFLRRYAAMQQTDPDPAFNALFKQDARDGMWRVRVERDDFEYHATVAILPRVKLTPDFKRQVLLGYDLLSQYGPGFRNRYYDTFIDLNVSDASLMFLPELNYARNGSVADFAEDLETELGATPARNPERKTFWTGIYYDKQALRWMVSVVTPIDYLGRYVGGSGQDVLVDQLIERTNNVSIAGTYNFIVTRSGDLIAHPDHMADVLKHGGHYNLNKVDDPQLGEFYRAAIKASHKETFVESADGKYWLGVAPIAGADWLFIVVYPKSLLQQKAAWAASMVLLLGMIALAVELGLLAWVLRIDVARPLQRLKHAIRSLAEGQRTSELDVARNDEIGELARSFDNMARTVEHHRLHLEEQVTERTDELAGRNAALEVANLQLRVLNEEKNELLTIAAHDLKNPVASIGGMATLLAHKLDQWPAEKVRDRLLGINDHADRIQRIIGNLLDINTLESGQYRLRPEPVKLDELVAELHKAWENRLDEKRQNLLYKGHGLTLHADRQALWQVLDNLISNASKYAPHQTLIRLEAQAEASQLQLRVIDYGPGIAPHEMGKLFRKFSRLSAVPTGGEHATGLGLSIVKRLLEEMGGSIRCESLLGHGATFIVTLPLGARADTSRVASNEALLQDD
ncbi:Cache domain-containing protein [Andreprevotia lacus DSM 23236]|jgi:signal transduction histidine kinase|uniref:Signal transduction histidine-protein kinase/phosphatase MprB n=1 Tax=Andreprevotia lacus DSM 23236 TaxID=1121001 RepID=A0A1W1XED6_9NEIS|nr:ATP-binding protein [Andreprevotia lacus]SMC22273.1 Cache domain-containing protein [Andreprevotia lacus DSM 23236]